MGLSHFDLDLLNKSSWLFIMTEVSQSLSEQLILLNSVLLSFLSCMHDAVVIPHQARMQSVS